MSFDDIRRLMGTYKTPSHMKAPEKIFTEAELNVALPENFDPRV